MSKLAHDETIHERRVQVRIKPHELQTVLLEHALKTAGMLDAEYVSGELKIEQETEGSPSRPVDRWRACVRLVQKLGPKGGLSDKGESDKGEKKSYDLRIFMRSGNVVEIDQVTFSEWEKRGDDLYNVVIVQAPTAQAALVVRSLDLDQVEAFVRLERGPDEVG